MGIVDPELLLRAYSIGVFPMSDSREAPEIFWVEPKRRAILPLDRFHLSRSLRKVLRSGRFRVTHDTVFADVVAECAEREETWINPQIETSYRQLHKLGHAHSIECWESDALVGGLYGVKLGRAFFGESMFSRRADASKVALAWLVARLRVGGFSLLDCQFMTDHLRSLGAVEVLQKDYVEMLSAAVGDGTGRGWRGVGEAPEFGALDRLFASDPSRTVDDPAAGCVIAQLLGHTS